MRRPHLHRTCALLCGLTITCAVFATDGAQAQNATSAQPATAQAVTGTVTLSMAKPIGGFTDSRGFHRRYFVVPAGLSDAQLTELARLLHAREKVAWLWLLDSDEKAQQMMDTVEKVRWDNSHGYPAAWVEKHTVAHSSLVYLPPNAKARQWVLFKGPYSKTQLSTLPCLDKKFCTQ